MKINKIHKFILNVIIATALFLSSCKKDEPVERIIERGTLTDVEGSTYNTVKIGNQWWMAENLKTSQFNDGTPIQYVGIDESDIIWADATVATYTYINDSLFGYLYSSSVMSDAKNVAPIGWHIPTDEDWKILEIEIGMSNAESNQTGWRGSVEGEKLTSKNSRGWPQGGLLFGTDEYGFKALPGGCRIFDGKTNTNTNTAFWWTDSPNGSEYWYRYIDLNERRIFRQHTYPQYGMSIRCVKD